VCACGSRRTLLPAGLLDLGRHAVPHESVVGLKLLHRLGAVVDEGETGALAATKVRLHAEDRDIVLLRLVQLAELAAELVLGDVGSVGVEDVTMSVRCFPRNPSLPPVCVSWHLHDHLAATEERVADELARAQSNLGVGHVGAVSI
jgi:hypothetical protein